MPNAYCIIKCPHEPHKIAGTARLCFGLDLEFIAPIRVMFDRQDRSVVLQVHRVIRDSVGRIIYIQDQAERKWNWAKMLWYKTGEAIPMEPRSPEDADVHAIHVIPEDS